jgi:hypothetical protein
MGTAVEFAELFLKRKVKLNIKVNDKERFYTGFILKIDADSKSILFEDKFNKVVAIDLGSVLKIEDFVEGVDNGNDKKEGD